MDNGFTVLEERLERGILCWAEDEEKEAMDIPFWNSVAFSFGTPPLLLGLVIPVEMFTSVLLPFIPRIGMKDHRLKWGFAFSLLRRDEMV